MPGEPEEFRGPYGGGYLHAGGNWRAASPAFYARLPRDPGTLYELLVSGHFGGPNREARIPFYEIRSLLTQLPAPADLRAALLRALSNDPSVVITADVPNGDYRRSLAVGVTKNGPTHERPDLLFDPITGDVMGANNNGDPLVTNRHAIVDEIGQQPS